MLISRTYKFLLIACALFQPSWSATVSQVKQSDGFPNLYEASIAEIQAGLDAGNFSSVDLVQAYFARIEEVNCKGPALRAVIETNPSAMRVAAKLDIERKTKGRRSDLHGIPILLKDNIATVASEGMNTTAGSCSLNGSVVPDDAGVVKRLRKAGAIILGKANLSEFSGYQGDLPPGWSGRGGQCTNAYFRGANPCGSSSGSAVAASIGLTAVTLGTDTDGSIICPSSRNNVVGIRPTVGLTSRAGVIPVSINQDTVGPITRSIKDAAIVLSIIAGRDPNDNFTLTQPQSVPNFTKALEENALEGKRIGVPRQVFLNLDPTTINPKMDATIAKAKNTDILKAFEEALVVLRDLGATIVDADLPSANDILAANINEDESNSHETIVLTVDLKLGLNRYFESLHNSSVRSLKELIDFNKWDKTPGFRNQSLFEQAEATNGSDTANYCTSRALNHELGGFCGIDAALRAHDLDALVLPSDGPFTTQVAAIVGYPIVTVPLGFYSDNVATNLSSVPLDPAYPAPGLPFGLSFLGTAFSEFDLIGFAYAYEQETKTRSARKAFPEAIPKTQLKDIVKQMH